MQLLLLERAAKRNAAVCFTAGKHSYTLNARSTKQREIFRVKRGYSCAAGRNSL